MQFIAPALSQTLKKIDRMILEAAIILYRGR